MQTCRAGGGYLWVVALPLVRQLAGYSLHLLDARVVDRIKDLFALPAGSRHAGAAQEGQVLRACRLVEAQGTVQAEHAAFTRAVPLISTVS